MDWLLTDIKGRRVVGVAGSGMSRLENEAGDAGVLDDVTPAGIGDVVGRAQHGRRWISIPITIAVRPVPDALPLPGATVRAGHATRPTGLYLRQAGLPLSTANRRAIRVLCGTNRKSARLVNRHTYKPNDLSYSIVFILLSKIRTISKLNSKIRGTITGKIVLRTTHSLTRLPRPRGPCRRLPQ